MRKITYKYVVSYQLLDKLEQYVKEKQPTVDEILALFRREKLFYRFGLQKLKD